MTFNESYERITDLLVRRYEDALMHLTKYEKTGDRKVELAGIKEELRTLRTPPEGGILIGDEEITGEEKEEDNVESGTHHRGRRRRASSSQD